MLARGLEILRAFVPRNEWLSNQEIASYTGLPRPTVSRIVSRLIALGYLEGSEELGKYRLAPPVLRLGFAALANVDIRVVARPFLQELADEEDAHVVLASRDGLAMVCNEVRHSSRSIVTLRVWQGSRLALPYSAMGLALIGAISEDERKVLAAEIRRQHRKDWPSIRDAIANAVQQMQCNGFCLALGTLESGINGIAVAIEVPGIAPTYALGVAAPSFKLPPEYLNDHLGPKLLQIKERIETRLRSLAA